MSLDMKMTKFSNLVSMVRDSGRIMPCVIHKVKQSAVQLPLGWGTPWEFWVGVIFSPSLWYLFNICDVKYYRCLVKNQIPANYGVGNWTLYHAEVGVSWYYVGASPCKTWCFTIHSLIFKLGVLSDSYPVIL